MSALLLPFYKIVFISFFAIMSKLTDILRANHLYIYTAFIAIKEHEINATLKTMYFLKGFRYILLKPLQKNLFAFIFISSIGACPFSQTLINTGYYFNKACQAVVDVSVGLHGRNAGGLEHSQTTWVELGLCHVLLCDLWQLTSLCL